MSNDPLLRQYRLKHLTLRNRIMTTAHEPACAEDGLPKGLDRAKGGVALTMTAGSASISRDGPPVFNNVLAFADEGAVDCDGLIAGRLQEIASNPAGGFQLFRIGGAAEARNSHAAIYDALRLVKDL